MFKRIRKFMKLPYDTLQGNVEDSAIILLKQAYLDLLDQVTLVSQELDQAIATEKQLKQTLSEINGQAAVDLAVQLKEQKEATRKLRQRLTELKEEVQKARNWKHMLAASGRVVKREENFRLAIQRGFAFVWFVLNISFMYLLYYFGHLPYPLALVVIPITFLFLCWIWWRENSWFFHNSRILWREMSEDLRNLNSKPKD